MDRTQRLDKDLLGDIASACDAAPMFIVGLPEDVFIGNDLLQSAVWAKIVIIGEAASRLSRDFRAAHPEIPWRDIINMRHRMVHDYNRIDWALVWRTVVNDMPELKKQVEAILVTLP